LHMAQLTPLPLTVSCFSKIQIGFTFLVPAHPGSPGKRAVKWVCVSVSALLNVAEELSDIDWLPSDDSGDESWAGVDRPPTDAAAAVNGDYSDSADVLSIDVQDSPVVCAVQVMPTCPPVGLSKLPVCRLYWEATCP